MTLQCVVEATDYELPHYAVVSVQLYSPLLNTNIPLSTCLEHPQTDVVLCDLVIWRCCGVG